MLLCAYAKLMISMFVDRAPFIVVPPPSQTRVWADANLEAAGTPQSAPAAAENGLLKMKVLCTKLIDSLDGLLNKKESSVEDYWYNQNVYHQLDLLHVLISLGLFRLDAPVNPLHNCDSTDPESRYDWNKLGSVLDKVIIPCLKNHHWPDESQVTPIRMPYINCQSKVCNLLTQFLEMSEDCKVLVGLSALSRDFRELSSKDCADTGAKQDDGSGSGSGMKMNEICVPGANKIAPSFTAPVDEEGIEAYNTTIFKTGGIDTATRAELCNFLLRLSQIPHKPIQCQAFECLFNLKRRYSVTMDQFSNIQLLVTMDSVQSYRKSTQAIEVLKNAYLKYSAGRLKEAAADLTHKVRSLNELVDLVTLAGGVDKNNKVVGDELYAHNFGHSASQVEIHQKLLQQAGIFEIVSDILSLDLRTERDPKTKDHLGGLIIKDMQLGVVFQLCHELIRKMCWKCKSMQKRWFQKKNLLLQHTGIRELDVAATVAAIVQGNRQLAENLPAGTLRTFINLLVDHGRRPRWLKMIQPLLIIDGEGIKVNQGTVMGLLLDEAFEVLDFGDFTGQPKDSNRLDRDSRFPTVLSLAYMRQINKDKGSRYNLMLAEEFKKPGSKLEYHTQCIELLAACAHGDSHAPVTRLRKVFKWNDCVSNILDLDVTAHSRSNKLSQEALHRVKAPFLRLLTEVYFNIRFEKIPGMQSTQNIEAGSLFPRWWGHDADTEIAGEVHTAPMCLIDEFISELDSLTARVLALEANGGKCSDATVHHPLTAHEQELRQKLIQACEASTGDGATSCMTLESMRLAFKDGSDPASVLHLIDTNGDGILSKEEFTNGLEHVSIKLSEQDLDGIWSYLDSDKNGVCDLDDFAVFIRGGYQSQVLAQCDSADSANMMLCPGTRQCCV